MSEAMAHETCPFCDRAIDKTDVVCEQFECNPRLNSVLDEFGADALYLCTNHHGQMLLYYDAYGDYQRDSCVWSDSKNFRVMGLLKRLGIEEK